jgi:hypothetical protein
MGLFLYNLIEQILLEKLVVAQLIEEIVTFMEPWNSFLYFKNSPTDRILSNTNLVHFLTPIS